MEPTDDTRARDSAVDARIVEKHTDLRTHAIVENCGAGGFCPRYLRDAIAVLS